MGNFSHSDNCWKFSSTKNGRSNKFLPCLADNFIFQKREKQANKGSAILDLVLTNSDELVDEVETLGTLGGTHCAFFTFIILRKGEAEKSITCTLDLEKLVLVNSKKLDEIPWTERRESMMDGSF